MGKLLKYTRVTDGVSVTVYPIYLDNQSHPEENEFLWAYHVKIENNRPEAIRLRKRYWKITDSLGRVQEVRGNGVVGEEPLLAAGEIFEYTSGAPLSTPSGIMVGRYAMESEKGHMFEVDIPAFSLDCPHQPIRFH